MSRGSDNSHPRFSVDSVALIAALLVQAAAIIWWAAGIDSRIDNYEKRLAKAETQNEQIWSLKGDLRELKSDIAYLRLILGQIKSNTDVIPYEGDLRIPWFEDNPTDRSGDGWKYVKPDNKTAG